MSDHAALLRRAATKARETAKAATCVPWTAELHHHRQTGAPVGAEVHPVVEMEGNGDGGVSTHADARHIALWHPGVALAVAAWLDSEARHQRTQHALNAARALLGEDT